MDYKKIAQDLYNAEKGTYQIDMISKSNPDMTVEDSYKIQLENISRRISQGEKVVGMKIGLTSKGMQNLLGVNEPDYGHLTDKMIVMEGEICPIKSLIQP